MKLNHGIEITIKETNALKTISNVTNRGYNMGIIRYQKTDEDYFNTCLRNNKLEQETIWEFEYVLVMSKQHPLAEKPVITEKVGRNDPCPCGSGKKFKNCCGA